MSHRHNWKSHNEESKSDSEDNIDDDIQNDIEEGYENLTETDNEDTNKKSKVLNEPLKKRQRSTLAEKIMILDYLKSHDYSQHEVVTHFQDKYAISTSSLSVWLQKEADLRQRYEEATNRSNANAEIISNSKKKPFYKYKEINEAMMSVVNERLANHLPITDRILREYWVKFAETYGVDDPKRKTGFSRGWLSIFKKNAGLLKRNSDVAKNQTENENNDESITQQRLHRHHQSYPQHHPLQSQQQQRSQPQIQPQSHQLQHSQSDSFFNLSSQYTDFSNSSLTHSIAFPNTLNTNPFVNEELSTSSNPFFNQSTSLNYNDNNNLITQGTTPTNKFYMLNEDDSTESSNMPFTNTPISYNNYGYSRLNETIVKSEPLDNTNETIKQAEELINQLEYCMKKLAQTDAFHNAESSFPNFKNSFYCDRDRFYTN